jgi:LDH2 family malate/lactate/ureidoglycolate dehydrogenase
MAEMVTVSVADLHAFTAQVFEKYGVPAEDAKSTADVLLAADRRGINSHGVARLGRYVKYLQDGVVEPKPDIKIEKETAVSALVDGGNGLGQPVGVWAMKLCIKKAKEAGLAFVAVRRSNHYGIAAYYSMMALDEGLLGISLTNSAPLVVPTFGKDMFYGTNPLSVAAPTWEERPFVLDMATSTVPRGKLEVYNRAGKELPLSWAVDADGQSTSSAAEVLDNMLQRRGGGLSPLGGASEETGGHKGYGLAVMVDIFTGVLSGGYYGPLVYGKKGEGAGVCHFFGAIKLDSFIPPEDFKKSMDDLIRRLKGHTKAAGSDKIWIHGEKEYEKEDAQLENVAISAKVAEALKELGAQAGVPYTLS